MLSINAFQEFPKLWLLISGHHNLPLSHLLPSWKICVSVPKHRWSSSVTAARKMDETVPTEAANQLSLSDVTLLIGLNQQEMTNRLPTANMMIRSIIKDVKAVSVAVPFKGPDSDAGSKSWNVRKPSIGIPMSAHIASSFPPYSTTSISFSF